MRILAVPFMLMISCGLAAANTVTRTWYIGDGVSTTQSQIALWHTSGSSRLLADDDGSGSADVVCCTTIAKGTTESGWTYAGGDAVIDNEAELTACLNAMTSKNSVALTSKFNGSPGSNIGGKIFIFGNPDCSTLVHEVGEIAGCGHVSVDKRFMTPSNDAALTSGVAGRTRVTASEKIKFEAL